MPSKIMMLTISLCIIICLFFARFIVTEAVLAYAIIFSIYTISFNIIAGYMGWISLGHLLYLGIGLYGTGLFSRYIYNDPFIALSFSLLLSMVTALALSAIVLRKRGAYFALLNLAFAVMLFWIVGVPFSEQTGGTQGMSLRFPDTFPINVNDRLHVFILLLIVLFIVMILASFIESSTFCCLLRAIKDNELLLSLLGYDVMHLKISAYILSGCLASLAGGLYAIYYKFMSPSFIDPIRCGEVIAANLLGGLGSMYGAFIGGILFTLIRHIIGAWYTYQWELIVGILILGITFRLRGGLFRIFVKLLGLEGR